MTNQEKLEQVLNAIDYLENDPIIDSTRTSDLEILAASALALREQILIDNAMFIVQHLKDQGVI